eukprot:4414013-Karenia_brevis.AAC.1
MMRLIVGSVLEQWICGKPLPRVTMFRGVKQGRSSSMRLFCDCLSLCLEPLLISWEQRGFGVKIGDETWLLLGYADDITLIAATAMQLNTMLQETAIAIKAIGLEFSDGDGKCQFIALESEMVVPPFLS